MFVELSAMQIWLLIGGAAIVGYYAGRTSMRMHPGARELYRQLAEEAAEHDFELLSSAEQAEVDRLAADGRIIDAVRLVRRALHTGLYEAKQIVDRRKGIATRP